MIRSRSVLLVALCGLLALAVPAATRADHVTATVGATVRLGEPVGDTDWVVLVDWSIACIGASSPEYFGSLNLIDLETGAYIYLGGVFSSGGTERVTVSRAATPRFLAANIQASCTNYPDLHGSEWVDYTGEAVVVPALGHGGGGAGGGSGGGSGAGGGGGVPGGLPAGACAVEIRGTSGPDALHGGAGPDRILGLGGDDSIRGRGGHDCLYGGAGSDRLLGEGGSDALFGAGGPDTLIGGNGVNVYSAGPGDDVVVSANGRKETVSCGPGRDQVRADPDDRLVGCERVTRI